MTRSRDTIGLPMIDEPEVPLYTRDQAGLEADLRIVSRNRLAEVFTVKPVHSRIDASLSCSASLARFAPESRRIP